MKEKKDISGGMFVLVVEFFNALLGQLHQGNIFRYGFFAGVKKISEQTVVEILSLIGQETNFQSLNQRLDVFCAGEHRRDDHQGAQSFRNPTRKIHARQWPRRRQKCCQPIRQGNGQMAAAQQQEQAE